MNVKSITKILAEIEDLKPIIIYCRRGEAISDFSISPFVDIILDSGYDSTVSFLELYGLVENDVILISTYLVIDELIARVVKKQITNKDFHVVIEDINGYFYKKTIEEEDGETGYCFNSECTLTY